MSDEFRIAAVSYRALHLKFLALENELTAAQERLTESAVQLAIARDEIVDLTEELNDKSRFCYAVEQALDGLKGDYIEIIKGLRKKCDAVAKADYERGFDDGFILRKEKDGNGQSEYICTCGIRVTRIDELTIKLKEKNT